MLNSILLHLERAAEAEAVIRCGVSIASALRARVRGLTLVDTRSVESALDCEAAIYAVIEQSRQATTERQHGRVRERLSRACLQADLNFDVRRSSGNPLRILPREARFHDLLVTALASEESSRTSAGLAPRDLLELLQRGAQPLLVVRPAQTALKRVLMVYDGTEASGRAIRSFLSLGILPSSEHRLLAIGTDEARARSALREMADYCLTRRPTLETGCVAGRVPHVLPSYAEKWQPDLMVVGVERVNRFARWLTGHQALSWWRRFHGGLFVTC